MAFLKYSGVGVTAMAAAVPHTVINNYEYTQYFPAEQVKEIVDKVGIFERRFVDDKTCSSDLCFAAAEKLLNDNNIDRSEIDLLIFISQTPDYRMPATSTKAQLAYSFDIAMQNELTLEENMELARKFVQEQFVTKGMIADLAFHSPEKEDGGIPNPHFHVMTTMRPLNRMAHGDKNSVGNIFLMKMETESGIKTAIICLTLSIQTDWHEPETLEHWREQWGGCR